MSKYKEALEKAKAYDEALGLMRDCVPDEDGLVHVRPSDIFSELRESDDEKIRKEILEFFQQFENEGLRGIDISDWIAWLEKLKVFAEHGDGLYHFGNNSFTYVGNPTWDNVSWLEKQGEQKPAEKVEPKFKVGDWIVTDKNHIWLIDKDCSTTGYSYRLISQNGKVEVGDYNIVDEHAHLWTIQDAKDGDVLAEDSCIFIIQKLGDNSTAAKTYYTLYNDGDFDDGTILYFDIDSTKPATKEQRDILFQKMHEEGYEWNAEKKELKKIGQKPAIWKQENREELTEFENAMMHIGGSFFGGNAGLDPNDTDTIKEQAELLLELAPKTEWSEEDERIYQSIIDDTVQENQLNNEQINWLKFLEQRHTWKPSDEQMEALEHFIIHHNGSTNYAKDLEELRIQLKKLKRE